jgi:hypothetical protein
LDILFFSTILQNEDEEEREIDFELKNYKIPNEEDISHIFTRVELIEYLLYLKNKNFNKKKRIEGI